MDRVLKVAIQKSGRLNEGSIDLIKECGIRLNDGKATLVIPANNFPVELFLLRDDDIPQYVADGVADIGIVGRNVVEETASNVEIVEGLGFGRCRLAIAVRRGETYSGPQDLSGKKIATSYPNTLRRFLEENKVNASIHEISGSVEIAPGIGLSDAVCDLVSSGSTLMMNGLKEVETLLQSEAVLISREGLDEWQKKTLDALLFRLRSVQRAQNSKYIVLNVPNSAIDAVAELLPGVRSPSILPLKEAGWSSMRSVVNENEFWEVIEKLREVGAQGILVLPIEKIIV